MQTETPAPAKGRKAKTFTPEQRAAYREQQREASADLMKRAVSELLTSEGWIRWAKCRARMNRYSLNNTLLIVCQLPTASLVSSYRHWKELNRQVIAGEHALRIFAPLFRWPTEEDLAAGAPKDRKVLYGFKLVPVFDVSQTEGDPLPEPTVEPITGDSHADYLPALEAFAVKQGYSVTFEDLTETAVRGYCDSKQKRIVVCTSTPPNSTVRTLIHEIAHSLGVGYKDYGREAAEVIVETATFIVCDGLGLDTSGEAIPYVASWGSQDQAKAIETFAGVVHKVAKQIEDAVKGVRADEGAE